MNKTGSKNPKAKKQKKEVLYTLSMPGDFPEKLEPLIDEVVYKMEKHDEESNKVLQFMTDILYKLSKKSPSDSMKTYFMGPAPVGNYKLTAKDYSAYLESIRLMMDTVIDKVPASGLLQFIKQMLISSITTENRDLLAEVKSLGKKENYSARSVQDLEELISLAQEFLGTVMANEGNEMTASKKEHSERVSNVERLYYSLLALYMIAKINESISKDKSEAEQRSYFKFFLLGAFIGETMNPLRLFHRQLQNHFFKMGASDGVTEKRWAPLNKLKEDAKEIADNLWSDEEENIMHHEMAAVIYESLKQPHAELRSKYIQQKMSSKKCKGKNAEERHAVAEQLTDKFLIKTIRDAVVPIAEKWESKKGCTLIWGKKGAKTVK